MFFSFVSFFIHFFFWRNGGKGIREPYNDRLYWSGTGYGLLKTPPRNCFGNSAPSPSDLSSEVPATEDERDEMMKKEYEPGPKEAERVEE